jgi:hypothetical protein
MTKFTLRTELFLSLAAIAVLVTAAFAARSGKQAFVLHNETGVEINSLYVSPHDADNWGEDILGQDTLPSGDSVKVTFDDRGNKAHWDLKVTDKNNNSLEWSDLNLNQISDVTLHWDAKTKKGSAEIKK